METTAAESAYCEFEPIQKQIPRARVLVVNDLLDSVDHFSAVAEKLPGFRAETWIRREKEISHRAVANIVNNVENLVVEPDVKVVHLSEIGDRSVSEFDPDAVVLSGTLRDFDLYRPDLLARFAEFIRETEYPVLGICGGHQLIGECLGARVITLDDKLPSEKRDGRVVEYQYRLVKITQLDDPIFAGIRDDQSPRWERHTKRKQVLTVWQNHGLKIDRLPEGFVQLARSYLTEIQMMVLRSKRQLIYTVQFHIEKSFEDFDRFDPTIWDHRNKSRDGRIIFENFLIEALKRRGRARAKHADDLNPRRLKVCATFH